MCQSSYAKKLEMMSKLLCVILEATGWAVLKRKGLRDPPQSQEAKKKKKPGWIEFSKVASEFCL